MTKKKTRDDQAKVKGPGRSPNSLRNLHGPTLADRPQDINRKGRPKRTYSAFIEACKERGLTLISKSEYTELHALILSGSESDLKKIQSDSNTPLDIRMMLLLLADKKYYLQVKQMIMERVWGKPKENEGQPTEMTIHVKRIS